MAQADALDIHHDTVQVMLFVLLRRGQAQSKGGNLQIFVEVCMGPKPVCLIRSFVPHSYGHGLQVELGCSREFAKAYAFARCGLAAAYQNLSQSDICHYAAANLSAVSVRLGE